MQSLKSAIQANDLERFIGEREADDAPPGDAAKLDRAIASMARTSKAGPATLKPRPSDD